MVLNFITKNFNSRRKEQARKLREAYKNNTNGYRDKCKARRIAQAYMKVKMGVCYFCKNATIEMHHPDYSKPILVYPVCKKCHNKLHTLITLNKEKKK